MLIERPEDLPIMAEFYDAVQAAESAAEAYRVMYTPAGTTIQMAWRAYRARFISLSTGDRDVAEHVVGFL
jgi:hypothetical protein